MEEMEVAERPGLVGRLTSLFTRTEEVEMEDEATPGSPAPRYSPHYRYRVTVRKEITSFEDAMSAGNGLKRGEQQIINLNFTEPAMRQKIVDFLSGVNFTLEGSWEEIGQNVYLIVPANAHVEVAPPTPTMPGIRN